jgi:isochorismate synthase EntC
MKCQVIVLCLFVNFGLYADDCITNKAKYIEQDVISVTVDQKPQDCIEVESIQQISWFEQNKTTCCIVGGLACCMWGIAHLYAQWLFANSQKALNSKISVVCETILSLVQQQREMQMQEHIMHIQQCEKQEQQHKQQYEIQKQQYAKQEEQYNKQVEQYAKQEEQYDMQKLQFARQLNSFVTQGIQLDAIVQLARIHEDEYNAWFRKLSAERKKEITELDAQRSRIIDIAKRAIKETLK